MSDQDRIRAARAEYARNYRKTHPEKVKAAQERYWLRKAKEKTEEVEKLGGNRKAVSEDSRGK